MAEYVVSGGFAEISPESVSVLAEQAVPRSEAGADFVGSDDVVARINEGWLEFDATIAMADQMSKVGGLGRILGRRGLMPNPRSGTVVREVADLAGVVGELKGGRVEFRNDRTGNVHISIGRKSFDEKQIQENILAVVDALNRVTLQSWLLDLWEAVPTPAKAARVRETTIGRILKRSQ